MKLDGLVIPEPNPFRKSASTANAVKASAELWCTFRWQFSKNAEDYHECQGPAGHTSPHRQGSAFVNLGAENSVESSWGL